MRTMVVLATVCIMYTSSVIADNTLAQQAESFVKDLRDKSTSAAKVLDNYTSHMLLQCKKMLSYRELKAFVDHDKMYGELTALHEQHDASYAEVLAKIPCEEECK